MSKKYFAYIRVSTARQGQLGTSLIEQRAAIKNHAQRHNLSVVKEFEEQETAGRSGRPIFQTMLRELRDGNAHGLIMHKIDRGARNLKDWGEIGDLIDLGIDVHFANENLDMYTRGGRLSADIQAVVAADYIRNLREETKKGFYGRIKQGLYPTPAPLGYLNQGSGMPKIPDPAKAPLIKELFEVYASRKFTIRGLVKYARSIGLRRKSGHVLSSGVVSRLLHNHFYTGIIHVKKEKEFYQGRHDAIVSKHLFDMVQNVFRSNHNLTRITNRLKEQFLYRRFLTCCSCKRNMYAEVQKHHNYYRCHTFGCSAKTTREELVQDAFMAILVRLKFDRFKTDLYQNWIKNRWNDLEQVIVEKRNQLTKRIKSIRKVLNDLTTGAGGSMTKWPAFIAKKNNLIEEQVRLRDKLRDVEYAEHAAMISQERAFEFAPHAYLTFRNANYERRREVIKMITETILVGFGKVEIKLRSSFENLLKI